MSDKGLDKEEFWKEMFVLFDKEDNNFLTLDELKKYLQAVGVLVTNIDDVIKTIKLYQTVLEYNEGL